MIAQLHLQLMLDNSHGYSQPNRMGDGTTKNYTLSDGTVCSCHGGDYDCSSSVKEVIDAVGLDSGYFTYTGNQIDGLLSTGIWKEVPVADRQRGDILWVKGHTGIYQGFIDGVEKQTDFHGDEVGGITGPTKGDQTGHEGEIRNYRHVWTKCLRYCGPARKTWTTGWIGKGGKWWYCHQDGSYTTNDWEYIDGEWYYFDKDGWMLTGWLLYKNKWYYLYPSTTNHHPKGAMAYSFVTIWKNKPYILKANGEMAQGESLTVKADNNGDIYL